MNSRSPRAHITNVTVAMIFSMLTVLGVSGITQAAIAGTPDVAITCVFHAIVTVDFAEA